MAIDVELKPSGKGPAIQINNFELALNKIVVFAAVSNLAKFAQ